jgi:Taurine catabolism dioxygenase TauD, TfdA family
MSADLTSLRTTQRQPVLVDTESVVRMVAMGDAGLPLCIEPTLPGIDAAAWIANHCSSLEPLLARHGAILFRGFGVSDQIAFRNVVAATGSKLMNYAEKATPRDDLGLGVYTSTRFPKEYPIAPHNELSYVRTWPGRVFFGCITPAATGGETPLVDVRRTLARIAPDVADEFRRRGWQLVRTFGAGIGPSWQYSYGIDTVEALEAYFAEFDVAWQWLAHGWLQTRQIRPAIHRHPATREEVWFNHIAFWHCSSLEKSVRQRFEADFGPQLFPYNTYYGDGAVIPDEVADHLRDAYAAEMVSFPWERGDFLMIDNTLVAHGRSCFTGERLVLAAMGDAVDLDIDTMADLRRSLS